MTWSHVQYGSMIFACLSTILALVAHHQIAKQNAQQALVDSGVQQQLINTQRELEETQKELEEQATPKAIAARTERWRLQEALDQARASGSLNSQSHANVFDYVKLNPNSDENNLDVLLEIYQQLEFDRTDGSITKHIGWKLLSYPHILKDNKEMFYNLVGTDLSWTMGYMYVDGSGDQKLNMVKLAIDKLYEHGDFINQSYFTFEDDFFHNMNASVKTAEFMYGLVKSIEEKQHIHQKYFANISRYKIDGVHTEFDNWGYLLNEELAATEIVPD